MAADPAGHRRHRPGAERSELPARRASGQAGVDGEHHGIRMPRHRRHGLAGSKGKDMKPTLLSGTTAIAGIACKNASAAGPISPIWPAADKLSRLASKNSKQSAQVRTIAPETPNNCRYLRQFGSRRVIVSCIPDDLEAYQYANQLVNILKAANWDAASPEATKIFGDVRAPRNTIFTSTPTIIPTAKDTAGRLCEIQHPLPEQGHAEPSHPGCRDG